MEDRTVTSFVEDALRAKLAGAGRGSEPVDVYLAPPTGGSALGSLLDLTDPKAISRLLDEDDVDHVLDVTNRTSA